MKMVVVSKNRDGVLEPSKRFPAHIANPQKITTRSLDEFITKSTETFLDQLEMETEYLNQDPATWEQDEGYEKGLIIVEELQVVNDIAKKKELRRSRTMIDWSQRMKIRHNIYYKLWSSINNHSLIATKELCYQEGRNENNNRSDKWHV